MIKWTSGKGLVTEVLCVCSQARPAAGTAVRQEPAPDARAQLMSAIRGGRYRLRKASAAAEGGHAGSRSEKLEAPSGQPLSGLHALIRQRAAALCGGSSVSGSSGMGWGN